MNGQRWGLGSMLKVLALGWLALGALVAQAADFSVGRVEVEFAEEGWREVPLPDTSRAFGGDRNGVLAVQSKLYIWGAPDSDEQSLVLVSANSQGLGGGRGGYMTYSPNCRSDDQNYREGNEGFKASFMQCLMVTPLYGSKGVFEALAPQVLDLQTSGQVSVQGPIYTVWSRHAISTGSFLDVRVFVRSPLGAAGAVVEETLPTGIRPEQVAWGRQLKDAVKSSVYSLSGRLAIPPIRPAPLVQNTPVGGG